jgi:hypothetical protein
MGRQAAADPEGLVGSADRAASEALAIVGKDATSQLAALSALQRLADALPADGVARGLVEGSLRERQGAFSAFHERRLTAAAGTDDLSAALHEAIAFTVGVAGDGLEAAALRHRLASVGSPGSPSPTAPPSSSPSSSDQPLPFFARFLERQER